MSWKYINVRSRSFAIFSSLFYWFLIRAAVIQNSPDSGLFWPSILLSMAGNLNPPSPVPFEKSSFDYLSLDLETRSSSIERASDSGVNGPETTNDPSYNGQKDSLGNSTESSDAAPLPDPSPRDLVAALSPVVVDRSSSTVTPEDNHVSDAAPVKQGWFKRFMLRCFQRPKTRSPAVASVASPVPEVSWSPGSSSSPAVPLSPAKPTKTEAHATADKSNCEGHSLLYEQERSPKDFDLRFY